MNKKKKSKCVRIADLQFSQPATFIRATGYSPKRNHLDTEVVSLHVYSETNRNQKMVAEKIDGNS